MKALSAFTVAEGQVEYREVDLPDSPAAGQLLVRTLYSVISPGTELSIYTGLDPGTKRTDLWCSYPYAPGYTGVGEVLKVGPGVEGFAPGDLVYGMLGHRSLQVISVSRYAWPAPEGIDLPVVPFVRFGTIAYTGIARSHLELGDTCLVFGLGCVGLMAAQLARAAGATVVAADFVQFRRDKAHELGADAVCEPEDEAIRAALQQVAGREDCEVAIDAVGSSQVIDMAARYVANQGEIAIVGSPRAPYEADMTELTRHIHLRGVTPVGALEWLYPVQPCVGVKHSIARSTQIVFHLHKQARVDLSALLTVVMRWDQLHEAYEALLNDKEHYIGIALDWTEKN